MSFESRKQAGKKDSNNRATEILVGPGLRVSSELQSDCPLTGVIDNCTDYNLLHRSNSLTSDGNSSPTSIMGSQHTASILSSDFRNSSSDPATFAAPAWSDLVVAQVDFDLELMKQGYKHPATISLESNAGDTSTISIAAERIKRKIGSIDGTSSSLDSEKDLVPSAYALETRRSDSSSPSLTAVSTTILKEQNALSSSNRCEADTTECDNSSWDRSVDEEERGKDEYISLRRRRRLNLIVPNPRKPRTADYMCSLCTEMYQVVVGDNPWWAVYSQQCPQCKQQQVPRIDINSASNAIELDPNVMALYGEGVEDSGDEECEGGSEEEDEAEKDFDEEAVAAAAEADQDDLRNDVHPFDGEGLLAVEEASKLLVLMCHARSCTGVHASPKHSEICKVQSTRVYLTSFPSLSSLLQ